MASIWPWAVRRAISSFFDLNTKQPTANLVSDHEYVTVIVFSPDSKLLLVCYERPDNVMKTWDTAAWQETASFTHATRRIDYHDVLFSPDGKELVIVTTEDVEIQIPGFDDQKDRQRISRS